MKNAVIYARVSTEEQLKNTSLRGQVEACQEFAKAQGCSIVEVIQEDGSAGRLDRPGLDKVRDYVARGTVQAVICWDIDRLSRIHAHQMLLVDECERKGAELFIVNSPREDSPEGKILFGMKGLFAEYERTKTLDRTRRGRERRVKEGRVLGNHLAPYGYTHIFGEGRMEIVETEASWVRQIFSWVVDERCSMGEVARRLDTASVPTKQSATHWYRSTVRAIISNPTYAGRWYYGRSKAVEPQKARKLVRKQLKSSSMRRPQEEWLEVTVPAIIAEDVFQTAQAQLQRNKALSPRNAKHAFMLRGLVICEFCGYRMYGHAKSLYKSTSKHPYKKKEGKCEGPARYYECAARNITQKHLPIAERCPGRSREADILEGKVWNAIVELMSDEERMTATLKERDSAWHRERQRDEKELAALIEIEQGLKREVNLLLDKHISDMIDRDILAERLDVIKKKQDSVQGAKRDVLGRLERRDGVTGSLEAVKELCEEVKSALPYLTYEHKQGFLQTIETRVRIDKRVAHVSGLIGDAVLNLSPVSAHNEPIVYSQQ